MHAVGYRIVIPPPGHNQVLQELHESHPGMAQMKALTRTIVKWPLIDQDIEKGG